MRLSGIKLTVQKVARHIQAEYARTTVIAHMSSPTTGGHPGWGKPGTEWDGVHFRSYILATVPTMREYTVDWVGHVLLHCSTALVHENQNRQALQDLRYDSREKPPAEEAFAS